MATKKTNTNTNTNTEKQTIKITSIDIPERFVREVKGTIFFTMTLNGVTIYNCRVVNGSKGKFIAFPQVKGKDGNYYSQAYAPISAKSQEQIIAKVESYVATPVPEENAGEDAEELPFN